jgi:hypothetical protein
MGYYIGTEDVNIFLDKEHFDDVYKRMCEINDYDDLKRGGSYGGDEKQVEGQRYNSKKWFSWMAYDYPETCPDMKSIFDALGFELEFDENGNLVGLGYWDKAGSEDYFLSCFAGYVKDGSYIQWKGEEAEDYYRYLFKDGKMIYQRAEMILKYSDENSETYEFGKPCSSDVAMIEWSRKRQEESEKAKALAASEDN